jgi:DNA mismatch endonuclease (patch repair protein)
MRAIRAKNTGPEMTLRRALHHRGFRFKLHCRGLPGSPDIVLPKYRAAIFVHGCFWHRHYGCRLTTTPKTRVEFWSEKFRRNVERDQENLVALCKEGWRTAILWQCQLSGKSLGASIDKLADWLPSSEQHFELVY